MRLPGPVVALLLAGVALALPAGESPPRPRPKPAKAEKTATADDAARAARQRILREALLDHFVIGVDAPKEWHAEVRQQNGARFDFWNSYLSGGAGHGEPWFFKYSNFPEVRANDCRALGLGAWYTWYMLSQSMPADYKPGPAQAAPVNARNPATMKEYFELFARFLTECAKHPDVPTVMQIEPDEWCHLLISGSMDPAKAVVMVGGCGMPELAGLSDDLYGYAKALARLRDRYAPLVLLGCNPSGWDWRGSMSGAKMGATFKAMCGDDYDLAVFETGDRDKGLAGKAPPYGDQSGVCETFPNHLQWVKEFHEATGLWVVVWQVALGNTVYATCDDTPGHECDNLAQFILEGYPRNDGIARYVAAGCCGWMFNGGQGDSTASWDARKDGITNPTPIAGSQGRKALYADDDGGFLRLAVGEYCKRPFPILAKPKPKTAAKPADDGERARPAKPVLADAAALPGWSSRLAARLIAAVAAGARPAFSPSGVRGTATVEAADERALSVTLDGGRVELRWSGLKPHDLAQLAVAVVRDGVAEDAAVAAFFLLLDGRAGEAEDHLRHAGGEAEAIRAAFTPR